LLGSQGYQFTSQKDSGPRTINEMRKEEVAKDMDPEKLKVLYTQTFFSHCKKIVLKSLSIS
jgi:hypothetical protein